MSMDAGLRSFVLGDPTASGIVGARMYRTNVVPANAPSPYIVYQRIYEPSIHSHRGVVSRTRSGWQLDIHGTYDPHTEAGAAMFDTIERVDDAIRSRLDGYRGPLGDEADCSAELENTLDLTEKPDDGSERVEVRTMQQYAIWRNR